MEMSKVLIVSCMVHNVLFMKSLKTRALCTVNVQSVLGYIMCTVTALHKIAGVSCKLYHSLKNYPDILQ